MLNTKIILIVMAFILSLHPVIADSLHNEFQDDNHIQLKTKNGDKFIVYAVGPVDSKQGLLLIHGWWGLTPEIETWANQFAVKGFRVMAVDIYNKRVTKDPVIAKQLMQDVKQSEANEKYLAVIKSLAKNKRKIAIIGRSFGANQTLYAAKAGSNNISAAIMYYPFGKLIIDKDILSSIKAPLLTHLASDDFFLPHEKQVTLTSKIKQSGMTSEFNLYKARHGFDSPSANNFDYKSHKLSLHRTYSFLNKYLN